MDTESKLKSLLTDTLKKHIELSSAWLLSRGERIEFSPGDRADWNTPNWIRFLRWELGLVVSGQDESVDEFEQFEAVIGRISLLSAAMAGIDTAELARWKVQAKGGFAKHANDPKQAEKSFVLECWRDWMRDPTKYKGKAAFARDMLDKCEHLQSQKRIEDWCREWEKSEPR